jgi:hypothetical protein
VLLNKPSGAFALDVCVLVKEQGACVRTEVARTHICMSTREACLATPGGALDPSADGWCSPMVPPVVPPGSSASPPKWSNTIACAFQTTRCVQYQQLSVPQWQEVWVSH